MIIVAQGSDVVHGPLVDCGNGNKNNYKKLKVPIFTFDK